MNSVDMKGYEAFVTLAEELHFTRAANRLGIAQPLLSQRVRKMERDFGAPLVERTTRTVRLTAAGESALPHAQQVVASARLMSRAVQLEGAATLGSVSLGYAGASSRPWLPAIARSVRRDVPGVELRLKSMVYAGTSPALVAAGDLDLAFSRRPLGYTGLEERIFEYERVLVGMPSDHPLAKQEEIDIRSLTDVPWVMFPARQGSTVRAMGMRIAESAGFTPRVVQEAPDSYTVLGLVAAGVGVTLTISSVSHVETPGLRLLPLSGPPRFLTATIVHRRNPTSATLAVLDVLRRLHPEPPRPDGELLC